MSKTPNDPIVSLQVLQAIGLLITNASAAENLVSLMLIRTALNPAMVEAQNADNLLNLVSGMEFRTKLKLLKSLVNKQFPMCGESIGRLIDKLDKAFQRRNDFAHGTINVAKDENHVRLRLISFDSQGAIRPEKRYNVRQIQEFAFAINDRARALDLALEKTGLPTLPRSALEARAKWRPKA